MNTTKNPISPQFQTWLANLSEFNFDLKYRKVEEHYNADGLSRITDIVCAKCQTKHDQAKLEKPRIRYINQLSCVKGLCERIREQQESDPLIADFIKFLSGGGEMFPRGSKKVTFIS